MFNKESRETGIKEAETIIGQSIRIKGNFHGDGNMIVDGTVEGSIKTTKNLLIGHTAHITASIEAGDAKIAGEINGNIKIQGYLEISSSANIVGDIDTSEISIEKGAKINGKISMPGVNKLSNPA